MEPEGGQNIQFGARRPPDRGAASQTLREGKI
jgi:hypothetical protein